MKGKSGFIYIAHIIPRGKHNKLYIKIRKKGKRKNEDRGEEEEERKREHNNITGLCIS